MGRLACHMQKKKKKARKKNKKELRPFSNAMHKKIKYKWIKDIDIKPESIKDTEKNKGNTLHDIGARFIFKDETSLLTEAKINKQDIKVKNF